MRFALPALAVALGIVACSAPKGRHDAEGDYPAQSDVPTTMAASIGARDSHAIKTVWIIVMENHNWKDIQGNPSAPYINGTLLRDGAHAERYTNPPGVHPSEPNYIWLEAGDALEISDDDDPGANYRTTKNHLTRHMETAGVTWRSFQEGITGTDCPLTSFGRYGAKHNPMVFFDDVTDGRNPQSAHCIEHVRPYPEVETGAVDYNFITPDLCNDMHDSAGCATPDAIANGDAWLSREVPKILASQKYRDGGAVFITWDESEGGEDLPIGLIALSPFAKRGYANTIPYTHSSLLRTVQEIFAIEPYIRDAARATSLEDLFVTYP